MCIYIYDTCAWIPNKILGTSLLRILAVEIIVAIYVIQSKLCNLCCAIGAMQSKLFNLSYAIYAMQSVLGKSRQVGANGQSGNAGYWQLG